MNEKLLTGVLSINSNKETISLLEEFFVCSGHFPDNREFTSHLLKRKKCKDLFLNIGLPGKIYILMHQ